jgi:hypothetical protein
VNRGSSLATYLSDGPNLSKLAFINSYYYTKGDNPIGGIKMAYKTGYSRVKTPGAMKSPAAKSRYHAVKLISNPNAMKATGFRYGTGSTMKTAYAAEAGPARKRVLKRILRKG